MKFDVIEYTWSLLLINFSINFSSVLRNTIEQKAFEMSYKDLFGLGIMMNDEFLKWVS